MHPAAHPPTVYAFPDPDALSAALADYVLKAQKESLEKKGRFTVAISGGSLPDTLAALIGKPGIKWDKWQVFYADERAVPLDHADSNHRALSEALYRHVPIPAAHIHPIDAALLDDLDELADAYEQELIREFAQRDAARFPVFDLVLLGVGPDGHTASLFPGHVLLSEAARWVAHIADSPKPPARRVTLTFPVLNHAARVAFVAAGAAKADVLARVLDAPEEGLPAARVRPASPGQLVWFVDAAAAARLAFPRAEFKL